MYTNDEKFINYPMIALDVFNILWAVIGNIISSAYSNPKSNGSALRDC